MLSCYILELMGRTKSVFLPVAAAFMTFTGVPVVSLKAAGLNLKRGIL
jgi:hypothetical protein